jgi:hypothetical protein
VKFTRDELTGRHRLSGRQADDFLGVETGPADRNTQIKKLRELGYFLKLLDEMKALDLPAIVLKGPALSQKLYRDPFYRTSNDFDLLFHPKDLSRAVQFFSERGFHGTKFKWPVSHKKQKAVTELINQHFIYHPEKGVSIEIHWRLFGRRFADPSVVEQLVWENTADVEINGQPVKTLDGEFELLYLVIHGSLHAWFRLKWLVDVHRIINKISIDEERFKTLTLRLGAERFVDVCNGVLAHVFPGSGLLPCDELNSRKLYDEALYQLKRPGNDPFNTFDNTVRQVRYQLALSGNWQYKMDIVRVLMFNKSDLNIFWLPAGKYSLFIFRPLTFMLRKFGWVA